MWYAIADEKLSSVERIEASSKITSDPDLGPLIKKFANNYSAYIVKANVDISTGMDQKVVDDKEDYQQRLDNACKEYWNLPEAIEAIKEIHRIAEEKGYK